MTDIYVRSTDGSDASDGLTWANAKATLAGAAAIEAAGDRIFVSQVHAESTAAAITAAWAGTLLAPNYILCGDDAAEPPTALATTATVTTTGNSNITIGSAGYFYVYGQTYIAGSGASGTATINIHSAATRAVCQSCSFQIASTGTSSRINTATNSNGNAVLRDCTFKFAATAQGISATAPTYIFGGSILAGGTTPTALVLGSGNSTPRLFVDGMDLSNADATMNLSGDNGLNQFVVFMNCKLPASWSGVLNSSTPGVGSKYAMFNCDAGDTNYRIWTKTQFGEVTSETTIIKTGGASDGTTGLSWKMVATANPEFPIQTLQSEEIVKWNETTGSAITVTVDIIHDSVTNLQNDDVWLEVNYLGTSGFPLGSFINDAAADILTAAADQTASSATWTTTGLTNPNKQKLEVTFTPQEKGYIHAIVHLGLASKTIYVNPVLDIT
jgi:hypothetical protein